MPISALDGCTTEHWSEVKEILFDAAVTAGTTPFLVSDADDVGVIQKRIIENLYEVDVAICDVSGKNSNVMFELGMRLAFDKPTIVVKDDKTTYSFDTAPIEHIPYPRDLRFASINKFKVILAQKISATLRAAKDDPNYTTFLKHFGRFTVAKLDEHQVPEQKFIIEQLRTVSDDVNGLRESVSRLSRLMGEVVGMTNARSALNSILLDIGSKNNIEFTTKSSASSSSTLSGKAVTVFMKPGLGKSEILAMRSELGKAEGVLDVLGPIDSLEGKSFLVEVIDPNTASARLAIIPNVRKVVG
jgi:hypothetical protein